MLNAFCYHLPHGLDMGQKWLFYAHDLMILFVYVFVFPHSAFISDLKALGF